MTWKKLLAGGGGTALLIGSLATLNNCTITTVDCTKTPNEPICKSTPSESGTPDTGSNKDTGTMDGSGSDGNDGAVMCAAIPSKAWWDNMQGTGPCDQCMAANCCAVVDTCFSDLGVGDTCGDLDDCIATCQSLDAGVAACVNGCYSSHPMAKPKWDAYANCQGTKCTQMCM